MFFFLIKETLNRNERNSYCRKWRCHKYDLKFPDKNYWITSSSRFIFISRNNVSRGVHVLDTFSEIFLIPFLRNHEVLRCQKNIYRELRGFFYMILILFWIFETIFDFYGHLHQQIWRQKWPWGPPLQCKKWPHHEKMSIFQSLSYFHHNVTAGKETSY